MINQTNSEGGNTQLEQETCLKENLSKSTLNSICDNGFIVVSAKLNINESGQSTLLSQVGQRDLVAELLAEKRSLNTRKAYERDLREFFFIVAASPPTSTIVAEFLGLERFAAISLVLKYKAMLIEKGLKEATVNRRLAAIKSLVNYARKIGKCDFSLEDVKSERNQSYRDTTGISADAFKKVLATCDRSTLKGKRDYSLLHLLWSNALRRNEAASLDIKHFDPDARTLAILGKGKGTNRVIITLSNATINALLEWLNTRKCFNSNAALFCSVSHHQTGHRLTGEAMRQIVEASCKNAGISKKMSPHRIRHSSITHALDQSGGNVRAVQRLSRHAKLETLMIYDDNRSDLQGTLSELLADSIE
jgi:integrase/recombinase XerC